MTPEQISTVLGQVPNLIVAVWVIINYQNTIKQLLDNQQKLVEQLMALHPPQDEPANGTNLNVR